MPVASQPTGGICRVGPLTVDAASITLWRDGKPLPLGRRAVLVLLRLLRDPGEIVSKETLYEAAWPGRIVEESNLTVQMSQLRRLLRETDSAGGSWIETLAGRGYRFTGPVAWVPATAPGPSASDVTPPRMAAVFNVPIGVPIHFTGRETTLAAVHAVFEAAVHQPVAVAAYGLRGVGKTILAAAYAQTHLAEFRVVWWLRAETAPTLRADLAALAIRLRWIRPDAGEDAALAAALDGLRRDGGGILLIYDNAIGVGELRPYMPKAGAARILITSNAAAWRAVATPIEIAAWPAEIGAGYLLARTGRTDERDAAMRLSEMLGGLPLAHEQAASYVEHLEISIAAYIQRFDATPERLLDHAGHAPADYHGGLTVSKAFDLAIGHAGAMHPAAEQLLAYAALLAAEPIPVFLFREGCAAFPEAFAARLAGDGLDEALAALRALALISRETVPDEQDPALGTESLRLHRLVRQVAVSRLSSREQEDMHATLIAALRQVYPQGVYGRFETWPRARRLDPLALPLVAPPAAIPPGAEAAAFELLDGLASFRHGALGELQRARPLFERAGELAQEAFGPADPRTAQALNNLALVLRDQGDLAAALPLNQRALAIREASLGPDHPVVSISLNNLANVLLTQGDLPAARTLLERALTIRAHSLGDSHPITLEVRSNLGTLLYRAGDHAGAWALQQQALAGREATLPRNDPSIANSCSAMALICLARGDLEQGRALAERGVRIAEASLAPDHVDAAGFRTTFAAVLLAQGDAATALAQGEQALAVHLAALKPGARQLMRSIAVVVQCLDALGRTDEAEELRTRHHLNRLPVLASRTGFEPVLPP